MLYLTRRVGFGVVGGLAAVLAATLLVLAARTSRVTAPAIAADEATALVAGDARARWAAVEARATTLAQLPRLAAAVATDEATVRDLTADELGFRLRPGETIELAQWRDGALHSLLRSPVGAASGSLVPGAHVAVAHDALVFDDVVMIGTTGAIAVRWTAPASDVFVQLATRTGARLTIDGTTIAIGAAPAADASVVTAAVAIAGTTSAELALPATVSAAAPSTTLQLGALAAGLGALACAAVALIPRRRGEVAAVAPIADSVPEPLPARPPSAPIVRPTTAPGAASSPRLGRYEPVRLLGDGGTSSVFLARSLGDEGFEKKVALKVLHPNLAHDERFRDMFLDEARLAAQIDHPNVVEIFDLGRHDDELFIAMEHIDGDDLESLLSFQRAMERATPLPIALAILRRICDGLHAAHTATSGSGTPLNLVHRDVKPGNVMISRNGEVKVGDFGIAKASQQLHVSNIGETKGTVQFMAPEQRMGHSVDARADVFGVGAVAYELITGVTLDLDLARLLQHGLVGWPHLVPVSQLRPESPPALEPLLLRALAYEAADRPNSCAQLEHELGAIMAANGWNIGKRELARWLAGELALRNPRTTTTSTAALDMSGETLVLSRPS